MCNAHTVQLLQSCKDMAQHSQNGGEVGLDTERPLIEWLTTLDDNGRGENTASHVTDRTIMVRYNILDSRHHAAEVLPQIKSFLSLE